MLANAMVWEDLISALVNQKGVEGLEIEYLIKIYDIKNLYYLKFLVLKWAALLKLTYLLDSL